MGNLSRRHFLGAAAVAGVSVTGLAACGGGDSNSNSNTGADMGTAAPTNIGGSLTWGAWANPGELERFKWYATEYQKKYGTKVTFQQVVGDYQSKLMTMLAGGSAPDVFYVGDGQLAKLVESGKLEDLTPYLDSADARVKKDDLYANLTQWTQPNQDGKIYGLLVDCNPATFWYNSDVLTAAGVTELPAALFEKGSWKFDALDEINKKITEKKKRSMVIESGYGHWSTWMSVYGGTPWDDKGQAQFDKDDQSVKAMEWMFKGFNDGTITYGGSLPKGQGVDALFYAGQLGSIHYGRWILPNLKKLKFKYDIAPFPSPAGNEVRPGTVYTACISQNKAAKDVKVAQAFLGNYVNQDGQKARLAGGGNAVPAIKGLDDIVTEAPLLPEHAKYFNDLAAKGYATPLCIATQAEVATNYATYADTLFKKSGMTAKEWCTKMATYLNTGKQS